MVKQIENPVYQSSILGRWPLVDECDITYFPFVRQAMKNFLTKRNRMKLDGNKYCIFLFFNNNMEF